MNNKGFTLVELVATIALLAIIAIISFVSINAVIDQSRVNDCENLIYSVKSATKEYVSDNRYKRDFVDSVVDNGGVLSATFNVKKLIDENYLSDNIYNPFENTEQIDANSIIITVELNDNYVSKNVYLYRRNFLDDGNYNDKMLSCVKEEW